MVCHFNRFIDYYYPNRLQWVIGCFPFFSHFQLGNAPGPIAATEGLSRLAGDLLDPEQIPVQVIYINLIFYMTDVHSPIEIFCWLFAKR